MSNRSTAASATNVFNINVFWSLAQARVVISDWKRQYNWDRPHSALGYQSPAGYAAICTHR
jgi:putative transposase